MNNVMKRHHYYDIDQPKSKTTKKAKNEHAAKDNKKGKGAKKKAS